jgi:uncharacterized protein YqeY
MNLTETVNAGIKTAMLAKDEISLRSLRAVKSALLLVKTGAGTAENSEAEEIKLLQKLVKQRKESAAIYRTQGRDDLAQKEDEEVAVIEKFLPQQMSEKDIEAIIKKAIQLIGASSPADKGKVMGAASKELAGKADNKIVSGIVKQLLGGA